MASRGSRGRGPYSDYGYFPRSRPRAAKGGVKAQSTRGAFGRSWWAKRWIAVLEGFGLGGRLSRGRTYARRGQVLSIQIDPGQVGARVQGSQPSPYQVSIRVPALDGAQWRRVAEVIGARAAFAAALLAGEMPEGVEEAFTAAGVPLFPGRAADLETRCSCPDSSNPCKHIAAVYYLIGEEFDRDPFLLFRLRGLDRAALAALLAAGAPAPGPDGDPGVVGAPEPLPADPSAFWGRPGTAALPAAPGAAGRAAVGAALVRRLGNLPFWRGSRGLAAALEGAYAAAALGAAAILEAEAPGAADPGPAPEGEANPPGTVPPAGPARTRRPPGTRAPAPLPAAAPTGKSRDRAALERDVRAGASAAALRARYDGRLLRPLLGAAARTPEPSPAQGRGGTADIPPAARPRGPKSRDRAALERDLRAGVPAGTLRARYDGRLLRPLLGAARQPGGQAPPRGSPARASGTPEGARDGAAKARTPASETMSTDRRGGIRSPGPRPPA